MNDFEDIKQLWESNTDLDIPKVEQVKTVINQYRNKKQRNTFLVFVYFILGGAGIVCSFLFHTSSNWTTTTGLILMLLGSLSGSILLFKRLKKMNKSELKSNKEYLDDVLKKSVQKKRKLNWHFLITILLLAIGYGFFIYQVIKYNIIAMILSYLGITLFVLGAFFILKPFVQKLSDQKIKKLIEVVKDLN